MYYDDRLSTAPLGLSCVLHPALCCRGLAFWEISVSLGLLGLDATLNPKP